MQEWEQELHIYQITPAPPKMPLQAYIIRYLAERDDKYLAWFLHAYENAMNTKVMGYVQEYAMYGHFADLKAQYVTGMITALAHYDPERGVSFLAFKERYAKKAVDDYIRTMRTGCSVQSDDAYFLLRKVMAMFRELGGRVDDGTLNRISEATGRKKDTVLEILLSGVRNMHVVDFYEKYGEDEAEEYISDPTSQTDAVYLRIATQDAARQAFQELTYREKEIVSAHLGFCPECFSSEYRDQSGKMHKLTQKAFLDIAADHMLSSPATAERIYKKALSKMRTALENNKYI